MAFGICFPGKKKSYWSHQPHNLRILLEMENRNKKREIQDCPQTPNDFSPTLEHCRQAHLLKGLLSPNGPRCSQDVALSCE